GLTVAPGRARIGDKLVATKFPNSITRGFGAVDEPHVAVCLLPGTEIAFDQNVECEPSFGIGILPHKKIGQRLARFRQINMDNARDPSRRVGIPGRAGSAAHAPLRGPGATVLQLPIAAHPASAEEARFASLHFWPEPATYRETESAILRIKRLQQLLALRTRANEVLYGGAVGGPSWLHSDRSAMRCVLRFVILEDIWRTAICLQRFGEG